MGVVTGIIVPFGLLFGDELELAMNRGAPCAGAGFD